jgi:hypothetical protein
MPREPKKQGNRSPNEVPPTQFRLDSETLDLLDIIARHIGATVGGKPNRSAAVRWAARKAGARLAKKSSEKSSDSC